MNESEALAVLSSDADLHKKAMTCDLLGRIGTAKSVAPLAKLLADPKLNDYSRDALERIPDPAAGKALLAGLDTLKGDLRLGVIITLGDRREEAAVPALGAIAGGDDKVAADAALAALGQIGSDAAAGLILGVLGKAKGDVKTSAANAALATADAAAADGRKELAAELRKAVTDAGVLAHIK